MDSALGWIGKIFEYLGMFIPKFFILNTKQRAVRWKRGKFIQEDGPGVHVFWPCTTVVQIVNVVRQAMQLKPLPLTTKDMESVAVGVIVVFEIYDAVKALTTTDEIMDTIGEIAQTALPDIIMGSTFEEIIADACHDDPETLSPLNATLTKYAAKLLDDFGVRVLYCKINALSKVTTVKLLGDAYATPGNLA